MNNRRLSLLVLLVVAAVALSVRWYLAAETAAAPAARDDGEVLLDASAKVTAAAKAPTARPIWIGDFSDVRSSISES